MEKRLSKSDAKTKETKKEKKTEKTPDFSGGWNYRIIDDGNLTIREVWYDNKNKARLWASESWSATGNDVAELEHDFKLMKQAFSRPILKVKGNKLYEQKEN